MIGFLKGTVVDVNLEVATLLVHGVGYELSCSVTTLAELQAEVGAEVSVWVHTHVREDALQLFGFLDKSEKQLFLSLLRVNGIGPKMALNILSGASQQQLSHMIENEDVKALSKLPKVGKKTAEQMILTLKGKLVSGDAQALRTPQRELASALLNLGFRSADVDRVVANIPKEADLESGLKTALAALTSI